MKKEELIKLTYKLINDLKDIEIPISDAIDKIVINTAAKARFGACKVSEKTRGKKKYIIEISDEVLRCETKELCQIIIHELLHTCEGCLNHGKKWKYYCKIVEENLGYKITRTSRYEELGLNRPEPKEKVRYIVKCSGCGQEFPRKRICNLVKHPERYKCSKCGNILYLKQ